MSTNSRHRRAAHGEGHESGERWLLTYADLITLLLALFIVLFAMSSISVKKFTEFKLGLTETFNPSAVVSPGGTGILPSPQLAGQTGKTTQAGLGTAAGSSVNQKQLRQIAAELNGVLAQRGLGNFASVAVGSSSVVVQILADKVFFQTDSAALGPVGNAVVDAISVVVRFKPNVIDVQGFTDDTPITGGPFASNWVLSAARAADVTNRLNVVDGVPITRLEATGYSDTHPVAPNTTTANMAMNRRIDVVIVGEAAT